MYINLWELGLLVREQWITKENLKNWACLNHRLDFCILWNLRLCGVTPVMNTSRTRLMWDWFGYCCKCVDNIFSDGSKLYVSGTACRLWFQEKWLLLSVPCNDMLKIQTTVCKVSITCLLPQDRHRGGSIELNTSNPWKMSPFTCIARVEKPAFIPENIVAYYDYPLLLIKKQCKTFCVGF